MKDLLTFCIYEFPAAVYDLNHWEERFDLHIKSRSMKNDSFRIYYMNPRNDSQEVIACCPNAMFDEGYSRFLIELQFPEINLENHEFNKLLLFGSFRGIHVANILDYEEYLRVKCKKENDESLHYRI